MRPLKLILLIFFIKTITIYGQNKYGFAIINDKDGFTNVREEASVKSKVIGKIKEGELFFCFQDDEPNEWISVETNNTTQGFIHESRVKFIDNFPKLSNRKEAEKALTLSNDSIKLTILTEKFDIKKHKIAREQGEFVTKIDGKKPFGVDGSLPRISFKSIQFLINKIEIKIPNNEIGDLFEPNFEKANVYIGKNKTIYLTMSNSDGAGSYEVAFVIKDGRFIKRYVFIGF